ncbi:hypothetical protein DNTS_014981 [Danionella cerebrum]|uniref:Suppressor of forked domain-containing protein n=1 Tax=Danionella cerebrum TaxID=2873325 RepID=A0A553MKB0_9TELE|nr:hypothetical protein DNTS_014981 [Danionella translucida]
MRMEIWSRFLAFESNIGDLASILKVERRRFLAFKDEYEGKETALLVDRYKFMDLYPCSPSELKALGYKDVSRAKYASLIPEAVVTPSAPSLKDEADRKPEYPKPDTTQMIAFQPRHLAPVDAAVELITGKQSELNTEGNGPVENHTVANKALKRPNADSDEEEDKGSIAPPIHDIYRARQQKRIR